MRFAYKYRLYPNQAQGQFLENQLHEACELYNAALQERRDAWKVCRKSINYYDQAKQLKPMREEGLLGLANFSCCQDVLRRLDKTFQAFFARVRRGEKPGFPRFRSFRRYDSITFPSYGDGCRLLEDGQRLKHVLDATAQQYGVLIETMEVMPDHVHLFVTSDPRRCVAEIVNRVKGASSRILRQEFPHLVSRMPTLWSRSYDAGTVGHVSESTVKKYIESQKGR